MVLDNETLTGDVLANKINDFFTSITNEIIPLRPEPIENQFEFNECYIHPQFIIDDESVFNKLSDICVSKSLGPDGIPNWVLKHYAYILALPVASLLNALIQQQHVPRAVARALIGGGGIFVLCPANFFWNQLSLGLISKQFSRA